MTQQRTVTIVSRNKPKNMPPDQEWFWTEEWQAGERQVDEEYRRGEYNEFDSVDAMFDYLESQV